ncbi:MAG: hypothetical protein H8D22_04380 [Candidatus Cloacimonetes bacterium]|nr:hypothetical protein [Candidatus Cloacimonadota bacterium]
MAKISDLNLLIGRNHLSYGRLEFGDEIAIPLTGYMYGWFKTGTIGSSDDIYMGLSLNEGFQIRIKQNYIVQDDKNYWDFVVVLDEITYPESDTEYFFLGSWDISGDTAKYSLFIIANGNMASLSYQELTECLAFPSSNNYNEFTFNIDADQVVCIGGRYISASNINDINTVKNIANFMPAFDNMIGYKYLDINIIEDGNFDTGTPWTFNGNWTYDAINKEADCSSGSSSSDLFQKDILTVGHKYLIKYEIKNWVAGEVRVRISNEMGSFHSGNGVYREILYALPGTSPLTDDIWFQAMSAFEGTIDNVEVWEDSHNNLITFQEVEEADYKEHKNRIKYSELNGVTFPDLYYRDFREEIEAIDECPSYLQMKYQETALIFTRNIRYRMLLEGTPSGWATLVDNVIEEFTELGLMNYKTLQRYGNIYFWLCELGLARMDQNGTRVVNYFIDNNGKERKRFNIPLTNAHKYIGFICPIRKQYLLHYVSDNPYYQKTYVYQMDGDYWQGMFHFLNIQAGIILTGGTETENINLILSHIPASTTPLINKYPGSDYTLDYCEILTKKYNFDLAVFLKAKFDFETGFVGEYIVDGNGNKVVDANGEFLIALLGGSRLEEIYSRVFNINYSDGVQEHQFANVLKNTWQGIPSGKNRGNKIQFRIKNATEIKNLALDYKR